MLTSRKTTCSQCGNPIESASGACQECSDVPLPMEEKQPAKRWQVTRNEAIFIPLGVAIFVILHHKFGIAGIAGIFVSILILAMLSYRSVRDSIFDFIGLLIAIALLIWLLK